MDYSTFDIGDFVADEAFVDSILNPTAESLAWWKQWAEKNPEQQENLKEARRIVLKMQSEQFELNEKIKHSVWRHIERSSFQDGGQSPPQIPHKQSNLSLWYKFAAIIVAVIGFYFLSKNYQDNEEWIVLENKKGHKSQVTLPDGTRVQLNVASRLSYPKSFGNLPVRRVTLTGEALFDVTENSEQPFLVETNKIQIKVLGTVFNVKSYDSESNIETTLVSGRVVIEPTEKNSFQHPVLLEMGQQAVYSKESKLISLSKIKTSEFTAWTKDRLVFTNKPFYEIKAELERWYDVEILVDKDTDMTCRFTTSVDHQPIEKVLALFQATSNMTYEIHPNQTITIKGTLCTH